MSAIQYAAEELERVRLQHGRGSGYGLDAFNRLCQAYAARGRRIDELSCYSPDESERFFANTAQGPDGHVYWLPEQREPRFVTNEGKYRTPPRWWWEHRHGPIGTTTLRLHPTCGDRACINPEHQVLEHFVSALSFPEHKIVGGLQVLAMRLGRAPTAREWDRAKLGVSTKALYVRYGVWSDVLRLAAMSPPPPLHATSPQKCLEALRFARALLHRWPTTHDFKQDTRELRTLCKERGLPVSPDAIKGKLGGSWPEALRRAGKT